YKERSKQQTDHTESLALMGDVDECDALIVDDIIGTAGTLMNTIKLLKEKGAKRIFVVATHGIFAGKALDLINNSEIEKVFVTDTIPHRQEVLDCPKIHVVSVAPLIAKAIWCNQTGESISENLLQ